MKIKVAGIIPESVVDGIGVRFVIFTQGCPHHCPGCHNPTTHPLDGGTEYEVSEIIDMIKEHPICSGVTISGGEPFLQAEACIAISKAAHFLHKDVWVYTGYTIEEILYSDPMGSSSLLINIDVLVDGRFDQTQKSMDCTFCGSRNQRIIDVGKTIREARVVIAHPTIQ